MLSSIIGRFRLGAENFPSSLLADWKVRLQCCSAAELRLELKQSLADNPAFSLPELLEAAHSAGWCEREREKLTAYVEYFSGHPELAHRRVMTNRLAETDFAMFVTACEQCYEHHRFAEGYALVRQFRPEEADGVDPVRYHDLAGFMAFCGGGTIQEACGHYDRILVAGLLTHQAAYNAYPVYLEAGRHVEAAYVRNALQRDFAEDPQARYSLGWAELARDYYPEGFRLVEARYEMPEIASVFGAALLARPRWQGEKLVGRRLLVWGEQGYGDLIMMSRYFPLLAEMGAEIVVVCLDAAIPLLQANFPRCRFVAGGAGQPPVDFDLWTGLMSLPFHFTTTAYTVPAPEGYLRVPEEHASYWKVRCAELGRPGLPRIGIAWSGNPSHRYDHRRSIAADAVFDWLRQLANVDFYALQTAVPDSRPGNLYDLSTEMLTFADTAAVIDEMDLVITVDTSVVHIAGALGRPTWLLLPNRYEWRWSLDGESNYWYGAVRVLRQSSHGDWPGLLEEVFARQLAAWLSEGKS